MGDSSENLITNGGGEQGTVGSQATGWTLFAGNGLLVAEDYVKIGSRSLKVTNPELVDSYSYQNIDVIAGEIYEVSGWIKTTAFTDTRYALLDIDAVVNITGFTILEKVTTGADPAPANPDCGILGDGSTAYDWTFVRCRFIPTGTNGTIRLYCHVGYTGTTIGTVWFDGITLKRLHTIVTGDLIADAVTAEKINVVGLDGATGRIIVADATDANAVTAGVNTYASTLIQAGKILISGAVNLDDWGHASDATLIDGGMIYTNSIVSGSILNIAASKVLISGAVYLSNWRHASDVTKIDGGNIYTNSITTTQIAAGSITANEIAAGAITADVITVGTLNASVINNSTLEGITVTSSSWVASTNYPYFTAYYGSSPNPDYEDGEAFFVQNTNQKVSWVIRAGQNYANKQSRIRVYLKNSGGTKVYTSNWLVLTNAAYETFGFTSGVLSAYSYAVDDICTPGIDIEAMVSSGQVMIEAGSKDNILSIGTGTITKT